MLRSFYTKNFRSIRELELPFSFAEKRAPAGSRNADSHVFLQAGKIRLVPCMTIFGANASGKTNTIRALATMRRLALGAPPETAWQPNLLHDADAPTVYCLSFFLAGKNYEYRIACQGHEITEEGLLQNGETLFHITNGVLTAENLHDDALYDAEKLKNILRVECGGARQSRAFLAVLAGNYAGLSGDIASCFSYLKRMLVYEQNDLPAIETILASFPDQLHMARFTEKLLELLKKFDFDIEDIEFKKQAGEGAPAHAVTHKRLDGTEARFLLADESFGTRILIRQLSLVILALYMGSPLVIDELDRALHPFILNCLFDMFKDRQTNARQAQLVFTAHTTDILENDKIRVSEIGIITKTRKNGTSLRRVSDFPEIGHTRNFRKLYRDGHFAGIPMPYI